MPFVIADRVRESSNTTGTGNITLAGAVLGYQTFDAVLATGDTTFYTIADQAGPNWEVGIGTFTAPSTLARTTILESSNGGSVVNFSAGTKDVFISLPASKTNVEDQPNLIEVNSSSAALRITQTGSGNALLVEDSTNPDSSPVVVDASGNVGIGTSSPSTKLTVAATVEAGARFLGNGLTSAGLFVGYNSAAYVYNDSNTPMIFGTNAAERMRIDATGNVGIGIGSPEQRLHVNNGILQVANSGKTVYLNPYFGTLAPALQVVGADPLLFVTTNIERVRIDASGNVGIGTSSPQTLLTLSASAANTHISGYAGSTFIYGLGRVGNSLAYDSFDYHAFYTNSSTGPRTGTEKMRIDASGNVGIGTAAPTEKLEVSGNIKATAYVGVDGGTF